MNGDQIQGAVTDDEIVARASALPEYSGYPSVDALLDILAGFEQEFPGLLSVRRIGTSRLGEPISLHTVRLHPESPQELDASRPMQCLVVGGVHPNEPIGSLTIVRLMTDLLHDPSLRARLGADWHFIACADPDAMRLNEGWFDTPFDAETYFRHFYRPPGDEQVEWTFPVSYKTKYFDAMLPETQALQRVIDDIRPDCYIPLHNSETGGAYFYLSEPVDRLIPLLHRLPAELGIPLHLGEPESAHFRELAPAVFESGTSEDVYEWREANGLDPAPSGAAGQSSTSYARRYRTVSLIAELPIWRTYGADDTTPTRRNYGELLHAAGNALLETGEELARTLAAVGPHLVLDTPFLHSARAFIPSMSRTGELMITRSKLPENDRFATVAERPMSVVWMYRLRYGGALYRALAAEVAAGMAAVPVRRAAEQLERLWVDWLERRLAEEAPEGIPVERVVGVQYGAALGLVSHLASQRAACADATVEQFA